MGYVFDFKDAGSYDAWFDKARNKYCLDLEIKLMLDLLSPEKGQRILDIGCGTGISLELLLDRGLILTGVEPSLYMLDLASKRLGNQVDLHRGTAESLPFDDNTFDCAILFTSLEFTERPAKAIEEACRVAKDNVVICVLNRYAPLNVLRRLKSFFMPDIYTQVHFFSIWELKQIVFAILGNVPVKWKTTLQFPFVYGRIAGFFENMNIVQKSCFGTLIGMRIKPVPKFRTRPLMLKVKERRVYNPTTGLATRMRQ
ncbi:MULTISPECIES: class I SAM-dependent methyltransferase [Desulfobacula]|uniref:Methyltransferase, type 11 n=2 Tax=Desulfobacula TaxID=28222 RepID=K0NMM2_DESTT|nr:MULTISPECIES: class I SAM-dependent methyltransferase [Desulfobacula]CCK81920.1 methyltransferase, type 11 [Desulfobacula toluolica Tol2]SDU42348.1 Methyltransferase domain-containing protein [Desulfobacula phenolica]